MVEALCFIVTHSLVSRSELSPEDRLGKEGTGTLSRGGGMDSPLEEVTGAPGELKVVVHCG